METLLTAVISKKAKAINGIKLNLASCGLACYSKLTKLFFGVLAILFTLPSLTYFLSPSTYAGNSKETSQIFFTINQKSQAESSQVSLSEGEQEYADFNNVENTSIFKVISQNKKQSIFFIPRLPSQVVTNYGWKKNIATTVFWIGEDSSQNNPVHNHASSWDINWRHNYGGVDYPDPLKRIGYKPKGFTPRLNPFYFALPYNDIMAGGKTKPEAYKVIPWFKKEFVAPGRTVLKGKWIAIRYNGKTCFAQWEDCGPFNTDDWQYVFGQKPKPSNKYKNHGAGLDVSPAVRDFLGFRGLAKCDWRFVELDEVADGPWKKYGNNNPFLNNPKLYNRDVAKAEKHLPHVKKNKVYFE